MDIHATWKKALGLLEPLVSQVVFDSIMLTITPLSYEGDIFTLKIQDDFHKPTIKARYLREIVASVRLCTHDEVEIAIVSPEDFKSPEGKSNAGKQVQYSKTNLRHRYSFDTFVSGKCTQLAYAASRAVSESPGIGQYNPLFLYGGVGLGKTHLLHSIGNHIFDNFTGMKVLYASSETFTEDFVTSLQHRTMADFKKKYRGLDVLLIDDVQFLVGRKETQEELFHTFNVMYAANKQIVITSDVAPKDLAGLDDRLISRFSNGLTADVSEPDYETRSAILEHKLAIEKYEMPPTVKDFIVRNIVSNIRDLEGALLKVMAYTRFTGEKLTLELAQTALRDHLTNRNRPTITIEFIRDTVAKYFNISAEDMSSRKRTQAIVIPRQIAMYLCRKLMDVSLPDVGKFFGKDHTTVIHSCDKITNELDMDEKLKLVVDELEGKIKGE